MELTTLNHDVQGLCSRMGRFIVEALKSQSANYAYVNEYDLARLKSYIQAATNYRNWVTGVPQLDCPETHPTPLKFVVPEMAEIGNVENESIKDWARIMHLSIQELAGSQSSRGASGFIAPDLGRFDAFMAKLQAFLEEYVEVTLPLDLPESSPQAPGVTHGRTGI